MKKLILSIVLILPSFVHALELKVGDILLQPLACWSCSLIEAQENSIYSHMGIVIQTRPSVLVAEALGTVRTLSLKEFNVRTEKHQRISVRRFADEKVVSYLHSHKRKLLTLFQKQYQNLKYDEDFLWDNVDENKKEKLYCSEMIAKLLEEFLDIEMPVKKMKYDRNRTLWRQYFRGSPPDGKWGNAPGDFEKSPLFYEVGEL